MNLPWLADEQSTTMPLARVGLETQASPVPDTVEVGEDVLAEQSLAVGQLRTVHEDVSDVPEHATLHHVDAKYMHGRFVDADRICCVPSRHVASPKMAAADVGVPGTGVQLMLFTKICGWSGGDVMLLPGGLVAPEQSTTTDAPPGRL
jgi:hypothetical protein